MGIWRTLMKNPDAMQAFGFSIVAILLVVLQTKKSKKVAPLPPVVGKMMETLKQLNTAETPWFLLKLAMTLPAGQRVYRLALPPTAPHTVVVADPAAARQLLMDKGTDKAALFDEFKSLLSGMHSVFTLASKDPRQNPARKGTAAAFSSRRVENSLKTEAFASVLDDLFAIFDKGEAFDPAELLTMAMMDILGRVSFGGVDFGTLKAVLNQEEDSNDMGSIFLKELPIGLTEYSMSRMFNPWRKYYYRLTKSGNRAALARDRLWAVAKEVFEHRSKDETDGCAILDHLVQNKNYTTDDERIAEVLTYLIAGHDTTGYTLAFTVYEVAKAGPEFSQKLRDEIIKGDHKQIDSLFERTCKEALRLWPVAAMGSFREVTAPNGIHVETNSLDLFLPKGATLVFPMLPILRAAPGVPDVDTFDPDRWLDPKQAQALKDCFFPFSLGQRNCIGMALAQAEHKYIFAAIVKHFDLDLIEDFKSDYFLTLKPKGGKLRAKRVSLS